jgi:hypothetical protein
VEKETGRTPGVTSPQLPKLASDVALNEVVRHAEAAAVRHFVETSHDETRRHSSLS